MVPLPPPPDCGAFLFRAQEGTFVPGSSLLSIRRLALAGMFAGLAWAVGYTESIPNLEFLTVILFTGGWVLGPLGGAVAGALGEFLFSTINPYGSGLMLPLLLVSQVAGMALVGAAGGWIGRLALERPVQRWIALVLGGIAVTLGFDVLTNAATAAMFGQWKVTLLGAIPFSLFHIATNAVLFATVGVLLTRALERTRRSLAAVALAAAGVVLLAHAPIARAQDAVPTPAETARADSAHADSVSYRDEIRASTPPTWGEGPATLLRRDDGSLSRALTLEGGFVERWADDRGSAEPLGRFGVAGANRMLVSWLGMPLTGVGAVGGETGRVPWTAVGAFDAPALPGSATNAYRAELGVVGLSPWPSVPGHPRVEGWAGTGKSGTLHNGFAASARAKRVDAMLAVEAGSLAALEPLGPEGDHSIAGSVNWFSSGWSGRAAYRSSRQSIEDAAPRYETRRGEGGVVSLAHELGGHLASLSVEGTADSYVDTGELVGLTRQRGRGTRATARFENWLTGLGNGLAYRPTFAQFTYGRETLESEGNVAFDRRAARLWWASAGTGSRDWRRNRFDAAVGAGSYGGGKVDVAPSLRFSRRLDAGTSAWAGIARGLSAAPDARARDAFGDPLPGDPPIARSSTWLSGIGVTHRSADQQAGGSWRGGAPRGALNLRGALYAGRSTPGSDPPRTLLAGEAAEIAPFEATGEATRFLALVATANWTPIQGLTASLGGHAIGRRVDAALSPSDPEARLALGLEERHVFKGGAPDLRLGVTGEWIGPRAGTPVGNLPAATRLSVHAGAVVDEFELRAAWGNLGGSNRRLPLFDPVSSAPVPAAKALLRIELRWTFWD